MAAPSDLLNYGSSEGYLDVVDIREYNDFITINHITGVRLLDIFKQVVSIYFAKTFLYDCN